MTDPVFSEGLLQQMKAPGTLDPSLPTADELRARLKEWRKARGLSHGAIAQLLRGRGFKTHRVTLWQYESGDVNPSWEVGRALVLLMKEMP